MAGASLRPTTPSTTTRSRAMDAMLEAARIYDEPRYRAAAEKGGEFILLAQMPEPQPGWAQQYDRDMHPAWARQFEPPSITGGESQGIMRTLLLLSRNREPEVSGADPARTRLLQRSILPPADHPSESAGARSGGRPAWRASTNCRPTGHCTSRRGRG